MGDRNTRMRLGFGAGCAVLFLTGCSPISLAVLGGGTSAFVSHNLNNSASRSFSSPLPKVRQASLTALGTMGVSVAADGKGGGATTIKGSANGRSVEIEFEELGRNLTLMRAIVRKNALVGDTATANEIVNQTEWALAKAPSRTAVASRSAAPRRVVW